MVLIFKTNTFSQLEFHVKELLCSLKNISKIDFDFEDCDKILRVEEIELLLNSKGFYCKELE